MSTPQIQTEDVDIDIHGLLMELWQKKNWIAAITGITGLLLFVVYSSISPLYSSGARILIEDTETGFTRASNTTDRTDLFDKEAIGSQVEVIGSDTVTLAVIKNLGLSSLAEFAPNENQSVVSDVLSVFGLGSRRPNISADARILQKFKEKLTVASVTDSRVIVIEFSSRNPQIAQAVPNEIAAEFLKLQKDASLTATEDATQWLGPEVAKLRESVRSAEAAVAEYRANSDIFQSNNNGSLISQQLSETSTELTKLRAERAAASARVSSISRAIKKGSKLESVPEVAGSVIVQRLRENKLNLRAQISDLSTSLLPNHPRLRALNSQLADFDRQINEAAHTILTGLSDNVAVTRDRETELRREMNRLRSEAERVGKAEVELHALEREALAQSGLLQSYLSRYHEAASRKNNQFVPVNAKVISPANLPLKPYFPKIVPYSIAGAVVACVLSIIGILAWSLVSGRALIEVSGSVKTEGLPMNNFAVSEVITYPEARVSQALSNLGSARIAIVSAEGAQTPSIGWKFARNLAHDQKRVALLDLSAEQGAVSAILGRVDLAGISDVIAGRTSLSQAVYKDPATSVLVFPAGAGLSRCGSDGLAQISEFVDELSESFDYVILDCGASSANAIHPISRADTVIVVNTTGADVGNYQMLTHDLQSRGYQEVIAMTEDVYQNPMAKAA